MSKTKQTFSFKNWIEFYGRTRLAADMGVVKSTVDKWAQGKSIPEVKFLRKIKKLSGGRVDYINIIDGVGIVTHGEQTIAGA